jgi:cell division protein ZapA
VKLLHRIRVLGREIQVRSSATPEAVQEVEAYIDRKIAEVSASIPAADQQLVTLLTLLNIAESFLALQRGGAQGCSSFQENVDRITAKIEMALGEGKLPES